MLLLLQLCLLIGELLLAISILYVDVLSFATRIFTKQREEKPKGSVSSPAVPTTNFAILIPAHNEEALIGQLLLSLEQLNYPGDLYTIYVIADNCNDSTAEQARHFAGVQVYERDDLAHKSKGYALRWIMQQLEQEHKWHDAYVIFDADSVVHPDFLAAMAVELVQGEQALQGDYRVLNTLDSPGTVLRWLSMTLINYMRPFSRSKLGFSSRLTGNGMCFSHTFLQQYPWRFFASSEDYEYYLWIVQQGQRVQFVADAQVSAHMPTTFAQMRSQDIRWEADFFETFKKWRLGLGLLRAGWRLRSLICIEAVLELSVPPLSRMVGSAVLALLVALCIKSLLCSILALILLGGIAYYISTAFYLAKPPSRVYALLLWHAPRFMLWKLWVIFVLRWRGSYRKQWIRTARPALSTQSSQPEHTNDL